MVKNTNRLKSNRDTLNWHQTQDDEYLDLMIGRLKQPKLIWVNQFCELINIFLKEKKSRFSLTELSINDFGCNVGHFFRGCDDLNIQIDYRGFDISETYLNVAKSHFGTSDKHSFNFLDVASVNAASVIPTADVAVISATLEHIDDYKSALQNICEKTRHLVLIRTFIGEETLSEMYQKRGATHPYLIRQFTIQDLMCGGLSSEWSYTKHRDEATGSTEKLISKTPLITRTQWVLALEKPNYSEE